MAGSQWDDNLTKEVNALNDKQRAFALEYRKDRNGTQAVIRAGYSKVGASTQAARLLRNAGVQALIKAADAPILAEVRADGDRVLKELAAVGFSDLLAWYNDDGTLKHPKDMSPEARAAIAGLEFEELWEGDKANGPDGESAGRFVIGRVVKIKLWDKPKALVALGQNHGLFKQKVELSADESYTELLLAARAKLEAK